MKKKSTLQTLLRLSVTLLVITGVMAALLAGVNAITKEKIAAAKAEKTQNAIEEVLPGVTDATEIEFSDDSGLVSKVYESSLGYGVEVNPSGFNGTVTVMVGVGRDGKVLGISIVQHTETAGLGAVAGEDSAKGEAFRDQFRGKNGDLAVTKDGGTIDALTGATITSRAVVEGVNAALDCVESLRGEG